MSWLQNFLDNTIFQALITIMGILGFGWGFYSHFFSNKKQRISTVFSSFEIIKQGKETIPKLSLSFGGKEINDLTITKFAIWNSGNKIIHGADIVSTQKLRVFSEDSAEILDAQIVTESDESNCFSLCGVFSNQVCIDFDYVDSHDGIVLQVIHTGSANSLKVDCKIKGGKPIKCLGTGTSKKIEKPKKQKVLRKVMAVLIVVEMVLMFLMVGAITLVNMGVLSQDVFTYIDKATGMSNKTTLLIIMLWSLIFVALMLTIKLLKRAFLIGVPTKLKSYENSFDH